MVIFITGSDDRDDYQRGYDFATSELFEGEPVESIEHLICYAGHPHRSAFDIGAEEAIREWTKAKQEEDNR